MGLLGEISGLSLSPVLYFPISSLDPYIFKTDVPLWEWRIQIHHKNDIKSFEKIGFWSSENYLKNSSKYTDFIKG